MIIDFHTHTFPDALAGRAVRKLAESARAMNYLDGTLGALEASMEEAGIDCSVLLPVVTRPGQQEDINRAAVERNARFSGRGVLSFGGVHPDNEDYRGILQGLAAGGVKGVKIHPLFQQTPLDDIRYMRIIDCACENGLAVTVHAGYDIGYPGVDYASVPRIISVLERVKPDKLVLAHMGGWDCWEEVESEIVGRDVYLDTSFSLLPIAPAPGTVRGPEETPPLGRERFLRMVRRHGAGRVLFGTDSPWAPQGETLEFLRDSGLKKEELSAILGGNGAKLLGLGPCGF